MLFFYKLASVLNRAPKPDSTPDSVKRRWKTISNRARFILSIVAGIYLYIGFELASPGYSFVDKLAFAFKSFSAEQTTLISTIENFFHVPQGFVGKWLFKALIFLLLCLYFVYTVLLRDDFSNHSYLRRLAARNHNFGSGRKFFARPMDSDLSSYSEALPSNNLENLCVQCKNKHQRKCNNEIRDKERLIDKYSYGLWSQLLVSAINAEDLNLVLRNTFYCRIIFHLRFILWTCSWSLFAAYVIHRIFEKFLFPEVLSPNLLLLGMIFAGWLLCIALGPEIQKTRFKPAKSRWERLANDFHQIKQGPDFEKSYKIIFSNLICKENENPVSFLEKPAKKNGAKSHAPYVETSLCLLESLIHYLNRHVVMKLVSIAEGGTQTKKRDAFFNEVIIQLEKFFQANFSNEEFKAIFIEPNDKHLNFSSEEARSTFFDALHASNKSSNEYFCASRHDFDSISSPIPVPEGVGSIFAVPLRFSSDHAEDINKRYARSELTKRKLSLSKRGFVAIYSSNARRFSKDFEEINYTIVYAFAHRAAFEAIRSDPRFLGESR